MSVDAARRDWLRRGAGLGLAGWACRVTAAEIDLQRHGLVLLIRHAITDAGIGDPPGFQLGVCSTQRNLNADGRAQARRLGVQIAERGWAPQRVRSSAWCRCIDTAQEAFGRSEPWSALNSVFQGRNSEPAQTAALRVALAALERGRIEAWVTHQVNVTALTGQSVSMGEVLLLRGGAAEAVVVGRWAA